MHHSTYTIRVSASGVPHVPRTVGPQAATGFPPRHAAAWSGFYDRHARQPHVTHRLPEYSAQMYKRVPGVGEVGWGPGVEPAWHFGPKHALAARAARDALAEKAELDTRVQVST